MGRRLKSDDEKRLTGSKLGPPEFKLIPGEPFKPRGLSPRAGQEWDKLLGEMRESGIQMCVAYRAALTQACTVLSDLAEAWADIREHGRYVTSASGVRKLNPAVTDTSALNATLSKCLWQLGLTPRARQTPSPKKESDGPDELDRILNGEDDEDTPKAALCSHGRELTTCALCTTEGN